MLRSYFKDDITVHYNEGYEWGEPLATTDVNMKAYIVWKTHLVRKLSGEQVISSPGISSGIVYVMPARLITHAEKITIDSVKYTVLDARAGKDFSENHQEIHLS